jgi:hypothetical protein
MRAVNGRRPGRYIAPAHPSTDDARMATPTRPGAGDGTRKTLLLLATFQTLAALLAVVAMVLDALLFGAVAAAAGALVLNAAHLAVAAYLFLVVICRQTYSAVGLLAVSLFVLLPLDLLSLYRHYSLLGVDIVALNPFALLYTLLSLLFTGTTLVLLAVTAGDVLRAWTMPRRGAGTKLF